MPWNYYHDWEILKFRNFGIDAFNSQKLSVNLISQFSNFKISKLLSSDPNAQVSDTTEVQCLFFSR